MNYNNMQQPYTIIGRFQVQEEDDRVVDYCRIKFHNTKNVQIVSSDLVKSGEFEDTKLHVKSSLVFQRNKATEEQMKELYEQIKNTPVTIVTNDSDVSISESLTATEPAVLSESLVATSEAEIMLTNIPVIEYAELKPPVQIIAINPKGEEIHVFYELADFCKENDLDLESVEAVLDGKQKTHRKWRFKTV